MKYIKLFESINNETLEIIKDCALDITDNYDTTITKVGSSYHINISTTEPQEIISSINDLNTDLEKRERDFELQKDIVGLINRLTHMKKVNKFTIIKSGNIKIVLDTEDLTKKDFVRVTDDKLIINVDQIKYRASKYGLIVSECVAGPDEYSIEIDLVTRSDREVGETNSTIVEFGRSLEYEFNLIRFEGEDGYILSEFEYDNLEGDTAYVNMTFINLGGKSIDVE